MGDKDQQDISGPPKWRQPAKSRLMNQLLEYSAVGIEMGAAVGIGAAIGMYLDRRYDTQPVLTLLFTFCGLAAAGKALWGLLRKLKAMSGMGDSKK